MHWATEYLQHKVYTPCPFVYKGMIFIMTNMAFESIFPTLPRLDSSSMQSTEEYFNRNLQARAQIQVIGAQLVYLAHEIHSYFENRRGKQLLLKSVLWKQVWKCLSGKNSSRKKSCLIFKRKIRNGSGHV